MVLGSTLSFTAAYILTSAVHELAHSVAAAGYGLNPVWHGVGTPHAPGAAGPETVIALAGPAYSLVSGLVFLALAPRARGYLALLVGWLGLLGVAGFFGYLISGPFATDGDIPQALRLRHAPVGVAWLGLGIGIAGLAWVAWLAVVRIVALAPAAWTPGRALRELGLLALVLAVPLLVACGIPVTAPLLAQLVIMVLTLLLARGLRHRGHPAALAGSVRLATPMVVVVVLALAEWLVLRPGVPL